ncbi:MAG: Rpn family recombination-promoting nuclease/putative transposase, partial [Bacteroidales bacterium]|nr:Rpn family recombination-promoting nuclease/putative transposase [Bacteroidales bacterium]
MAKHIRFDWAMKRLLRNKANFDVLEGFLSELLMQDIIIKEILESEGNKDNEADKFNRVDILVKNQKGELMLIEVQNERENDFFHRMNYGQAKLLTQYIDEGDDYDKIKKIYSINIVYFDLGQGKDYIYKGSNDFYGIHSNDRLELNAAQKKAYQIDQVSDIFTTYYVLKVNNFDDVAKNTLDEWIYFLKNSEIKDEFRAKGLPQAKDKLRVDNLGKSEKIAYEHFLKLKRIRENELKTATTEGYNLAEKEYMPIIENERRQKEEERRQKEKAFVKEKEALV